MKNGLIVFTPAPCDHIDDWAEHRVVGLLADEVRLATTEAEIAHCLWELRARGAGRVRCVRALRVTSARTMPSRSWSRPFARWQPVVST